MGQQPAPRDPQIGNALNLKDLILDRGLGFRFGPCRGSSVGGINGNRKLLGVQKQGIKQIERTLLRLGKR